MIKFDREKHEYSLNGKVLISVTQLLAKHGLAPDYSNVDTDVLNKKGERGTIIHKELEEYINDKTLGFTDELGHFIDWHCEKTFDLESCEYIVHNDDIAGMIDYFYLSNGIMVLADFKTTAVLHKEAVRWQLSLYNYLANVKAHRFEVFHFNNGKLNIIELEPIPLADIERLLEYEKNGLNYNDYLDTKKNKIMTVDTQNTLLSIHNELSALESQQNAINKRYDELKAYLLKEMQDKDIKSIDNELFKITRIDAVEKTIIDTKKLKEEIPSILEHYSKTSITKASVRITIR